MPLGRSAAHKICVSALELAKALISKEALKGFQRGVGFLIRWQNHHSQNPIYPPYSLMYPPHTLNPQP